MTERTFTFALTLTVEIDGEASGADGVLVEQIVDGLYAAMPSMLHESENYILFVRETCIAPTLIPPVEA